MRKRVLILDDDAAVLEILQILLHDEGFEAIIVEKTDDLIGLVQLHRPALILLDYALDGINGGDWCAKLKKHPQFAAIPVMIFTAYSNKGIAKGTYGCDDFIAKPFDIDDLITRIKLLTSEQHPIHQGTRQSKSVQIIKPI